MSRPLAVQPLVLVVEDEPQMRRLLVSALATVGYRSLHVETTDGTLLRIVGHEPDLILVDVSQPGVDAVGIIAQLREWTSAPILALVAQGRERERAELLDAGANDYLVRPFVTPDLLSRVRVWLRQEARARRQLAPQPLVKKPGKLHIDRERRTILVDGREVHLTPLECKLLLALAKSRSKSTTEKQLLAAVWGTRGTPDATYLRAQVRHLRQKIEADPSRPRHLVSGPAGGYRLKLS
jgi:two-component system, OmpR family, KDP operon response regulator KdpE